MPNAAELIISRLEEHGFEAYVVGGCVRDSIMGIPPHDWDICTSALPEQIIEVFSDLKVIPTGLKHGTVTVVLYGDEYEITTYRIDGEYSDNRHPEAVEFVKDLKLDLMRRDFTINALAYNHKSGIIDYFNGVEDIHNKVIRCVGNPNDRFSEDALRIMRAIRFATRFGFEIEQETRNSLFTHQSLLRNISAERINSELTKTLQHITFETNVGLLVDMMTLLTEVVPEFGGCDIQKISVRLLRSISDIEVRLALLFDFDDNDVENVLYRLRFSNYLFKSVTTIVKYGRRIMNDRNQLEIVKESISCNEYDKTDYYEVRLLHDIGHKLSTWSILYTYSFFDKDDNDNQDILRALFLKTIRCEIPYRLADLQVKGNDLISLGYNGKEIGNVLNTLLDMVMRQTVPNDRDKLIQVAKSIKEYLI
jgi:tRNA nucleotidyltransferase (CCA-adding enzyme)